MEELFLIGQITKPHGIKGEVRVSVLTSFPERFFELNNVYLVGPSDEEPRLVDINLIREHGSVFIIKFSGVDSRSEAEKLRNWTLELTRDRLIDLPEGVHYIFDLIDSEVITDSGLLLGVVSEVIQLASNDVYVIKGKQGEILIPVTRDIVKEIDTKSKKIIISPIEGLLD